jgi:hypothetical protein
MVTVRCPVCPAKCYFKICGKNSALQENLVKIFNFQGAVQKYLDKQVTLLNH